MENSAPTIVYPPSQQTIQIVQDPTLLRVLAADLEGDTLWFFWDDPGQVDLVTDRFRDGDNWISTLSIPRDPALDGRTISVVVYDEATPPNATTVSWIVEVP